MSATTNELENVVSRVPIWGWLALAGGAFVVVMSRHNKTAAAVIDPNTAVPNVSADPGFTTDPGTPATPGITPDPNNGGITGTPPALYNQSLTDIWGGDLSHLLAALTNQPDYVNLQLPGGGSFTESNAIATAGGGNGTPLINQATIDANTAAQSAYYAGIAAQEQQVTERYQSWLTFLSQPVNQVATGDLAGIAAKCPRGDTGCANKVAPWWAGQPIPGWS